MRAVVQRVDHASVDVHDETVGQIGKGFLVLVGVGEGDGPEQADALAGRVANLRIMEDAGGKSNLSLLESGGAALVVSQFTLYADCRKGRRPSFSDAAPPDIAERLVEHFQQALEHLGVPTAAGRFGAHMRVCLINDGPYTITLDTEELSRPRRNG
jgi:D-aminoacyl-tRNA deacylase